MLQPPQRNPYPVGIIVDIHDYCNANCAMCPYPSLHRNLQQGKMEWDLYTKISDDFSRLITRYGFAGRMAFCNMGEPFVENNLHSYTQYAEKGGIGVYLNTNASLMTHQKLDALFNSGFKGEFNISFHGGTPDVYRANMGLDFDTSMRNIEYLLSRHPAEKVSINALDFQWPPGEAERIRNLFRAWNCRVNFNRPVSRTGIVRSIQGGNRNRIAGCATERVLYQMIIARNGDVLLCCHDMARRAVVGNVREQDIQAVWTGEKFSEYLERIYSGKRYSSKIICNGCEESARYWSLKRFVKKLLPAALMKSIYRRRKNGWALSGVIRDHLD